MIGQQFGRLTVLEAAGADRKRQLRWKCACACGAERITTGYLLRSGQSRSCGCLQREGVTDRNRTHGLSASRLYNIWNNMRSRCQNRSNPQFGDYGGRGIAVCAEWLEFATFKTWAASHGYRDDLSIDRINNDDGYSANNCRWATALEQSRNKRPRRDQRLSDAQVQAIRQDGRGRRAVAAEYGVTSRYIDRIKAGARRAFPTERREVER